LVDDSKSKTQLAAKIDQWPNYGVDGNFSSKLSIIQTFFFLLIAHVYFWLIQILCESKRNIKYKKHNNVSCVCVYTAVHTLAR